MLEANRKSVLIIQTILSFLLGLFFLSYSITGAVINHMGENGIEILSILFFILGLIGLFTIVKCNK